MKPSRYITLTFLILMLLGMLLIASRGTSRAHFDLPPDSAVRVIFSPTAAPSPTPDPLSRFRAARETAFSDIQTALTSLITSGDEELSTLAKTQLSSTAEDIRLTLLIETALWGMGYPNALCAVQTDAITVFFPSALNQGDGELLCDLIRSWTQLPTASVRLIEGV